MKNKIIIAASLVLITSTVVLTNRLNTPEPVQTGKRRIDFSKNLKIPMPDKERSLRNRSIGDELNKRENPHGRAEREFKMLRDPKTKTLTKEMYLEEKAFANVLRAQQLKKSISSAELYEWKSRGPINVGGRTRALGIDISNPNILIAGGVSGGMWKSTDKADFWVKTTRPDQIYSVSSLVQDTRPGKTNIWYYGTGESIGNSANITGGSQTYYRGDGIFKSVDNGDSWEVLESTSTNVPHEFDNPFDYVWNVAVDPSNLEQDEIYAAVIGGIYRSVDGGETWTKTLGGSDSGRPSFTDVTVTAEGVVYAALSSDGDQSGAFRSTDGVNWTDISPSGWADNFNRIVVAHAPSDGNIVFFLGDKTVSHFESHDFWKYKYISGDGSEEGNYWSKRSPRLPNEEGTIRDFLTQRSYNMVLEVFPTDTNIVFIGGINLHRSDDAFMSDSLIYHIGGYRTDATDESVRLYSGHHPDQHALVFSPNDPEIAYSAHDGGISKTPSKYSGITNKSTVWQFVNDGYVTGQFYGAAQVPGIEGDGLLAGGMQDNGSYLADSDSKSWFAWVGGDGGYTALSDSGDAVYLSWQGGGIFRFMNDPEDDTQLVWTYITPAGESNFSFINPYILDKNNNDVIYIPARQAIWRNSNISMIPLDGTQSEKTINWSKITITEHFFGDISSIAVSKNPKNILYVGTDMGEVIRIDSAKTKSSYAGEKVHWLKETYVSSVTIHPEDADKVMVTHSNHNSPSVFYTEDGGTNWTDVSGSLEENPDGSGGGPSARTGNILVFGGETKYFVGTSIGLFSTLELNGAQTVWEKEGNDVIGNAIINSIDTRNLDGEVVVATHGSGVFSRADLITAVEDDDTDSGSFQPTSFELKQNYPNPFNPETTIAFELPRNANITITIYNVLGQKVRTLVDNQLVQAGKKRVKFDGMDDYGRRISSGVYIYKLTDGKNVQSRKMVLIK